MTYWEIFIILVVVAGAMVALFYSRRSQSKLPQPDPREYIEGLRALLNGRDELAFTKLREVVNNDTNNVDAYIRLGNIFRRQNKPEQALQVHRDLTYRHNLSPEEKIEILSGLYYDFMDLDDESAANKAVGEILELRPNNRFALATLLAAYEKSGEWKNAVSIRGKLDKINGHDSSRMLALYKVFEGQDLASQGDLHRARLFFKEAVHLNKLCIPAYVAIGDSYYKDKRLEDALGYWTKVITMRPQLGHLVFDRLKKGFFEVGRYGEYADALTNLLQACPDHLTARLELAYFQEKKGDLDAAREHYSAAQDNHPDSMLGRLGTYRLNRNAGKKQQADTVFKQIMKMAVKREAGNFRCGSCDLDSENMMWLCPRCKAVDSFQPVKS